MLCQLREEEIQARQKRNLWVMIGLNVIFYILITIWTILCVLDILDDERFDLAIIMASVNPLMPALVLIFAILSVKSQIKKLNQKEIIAREKLIHMHTFTFIFIVLAYFVMGIVAYEA